MISFISKFHTTWIKALSSVNHWWSLGLFTGYLYMCECVLWAQVSLCLVSSGADPLSAGVCGLPYKWWFLENGSSPPCVSVYVIRAQCLCVSHLGGVTHRHPAPMWSRWWLAPWHVYKHTDTASTTYLLLQPTAGIHTLINTPNLSHRVLFFHRE